MIFFRPVFLTGSCFTSYFRRLSGRDEPDRIYPLFAGSKA